MTAEMIGVQRSYFEQISGLAKRVNGNYREYDVGGCVVSISEDKKQAISSIALGNISSDCTFNAEKIYLKGPAHKLTFAKLNEVGNGSGAFEVCLETHCGNLADPVYALAVETPRAMTNIGFTATVEYTDESGEAAWRLKKNIEKRFPGVELYGDYLGKKIPENIYTEMWLKEFGNVHITSIRFGY